MKPIFVPVIVGMITPSLIIVLMQVFLGEYSIGQAVNDTISKQFEDGHNLFGLALTGIIPFVLLSIMLFFFGRKHNTKKVAVIMLCGLFGILVLMVPAHYSVWAPLYDDSHMSSTAVIAFLFIPFYCIVPMLIGVLIGYGIIKEYASKI